MLFISGLPFGAVLLTIAAAIGVLLFLFPQLREVAVAAFNGIIALWTSTVAGLTAQGESLKQFFIDLWNGIVNAFSTAVSQITSFFGNLLASAKATLQPILDLLKAIAELAGGSGAAGNVPGAVTAARGGHIRGPGSSTSDSIPAWLSDNEFVIKAKSVAKYGVGLLHAINSGRFKMPRFNMGGLVSSMISPQPRFAYADGGEVSASAATLRPINVSIMGENFPMFAPEEVGERLTKFAVARQTRSAGRKPSWLGRGRN